MKKVFLLVLIFLYLISCIKKSNRSCQYKLDELLKTDSSRIYVSVIESGVILEVRDKGRDSSFGPSYSFDEKGNLKLYAFLVGDDKYGYMEEYDSTGNLVKKEGIPIVQKMIFKKSADSIQFTYFFFSLNKKYENIEIFTNEKYTIRTEMFKNSHYTNMRSASFTLPVNSKNSQSLIIYSKGDVINLCDHSKEHFNDTTFLKNINL